MTYIVLKILFWVYWTRKISPNSLLMWHLLICHRNTIPRDTHWEMLNSKFPLAFIYNMFLWNLSSNMYFWILKLLDEAFSPRWHSLFSSACTEEVIAWNHSRGWATHTVIFLSFAPKVCCLSSVQGSLHVPAQHILPQSIALYNSTQALVRITESEILRPPPYRARADWGSARERTSHSKRIKRDSSLINSHRSIHVYAANKQNSFKKNNYHWNATHNQSSYLAQ